MSECSLGEVVDLVRDKIDVSNIDVSQYISTDNMLPDLGGLEPTISFPSVNKVVSFQKGDVLFSNIRTYFRKVWFASINGGCSNDVLVFRANELIDQSFLYYLISSKSFTDYSVKTSKGTKMPRGDKEAMFQYKFNLPPLDEQKYIAKILSDFDHKIEFNRKINEILEQMAQSLFRSWFVDFDTVIDNALNAGNEIPEELSFKAVKRKSVDYSKKLFNTNSELANLFPSSFEYSEQLGKWIPEGWEVKHLEEIADCNKNSWSNKNRPETVEYVDLANTKNGMIQETVKYIYDEAPSRARRILNIGDTIFGTVRPGNRSYSYIDREGLTGSTGFAVFSPKSQFQRAYVYLFITQEEIINLLAHLADGAAYPAINSQVIADLDIILPSEDIQKYLQKTAGVYLKKSAENKKQNEALRETRDRLLPRLISGQISIAELKESYA